MRAMILAAGRGERMRPLTDHQPKPLLSVGGKPLIVWHLERLAAAGINDIVINHAWLGEQIPATLGNGNRYGVSIHYSDEAPSALETAGGIANALPLLGSDPFLVINGDIWCDWSPEHAQNHLQDMDRAKADAWLLLVNNPEHHPQGDFQLSTQGHVVNPSEPINDVGVKGSLTERLTFAGIGIYRPTMFTPLPRGTAAPLAPLLRAAMARKAVLGSHHAGTWTDVGTPERLQALNCRLTGHQS